MRRQTSNAAKVHLFMRRLGEQATGPGRVYLVGGSSAVLIGWRETTVDVDVRLDPEPRGAFEAIAGIKDELAMNVELAAPDDFIPALPNWRERSPFVARHGKVDFFHYDFYAQALAKVERGHEQDLQDIAAMHEHGLIEPRRLGEFFEAIEDELLRFPAIDGGCFAAKVKRAIRRMEPSAGEREGHPSQEES